MIADAKLWLDASNINGQSNTGLSDGDAISTWVDLSGNGNNALQSTASNQPILNLDGLNGSDSIAFNSSNSNYMKTVPFNHSTDSITIISVFKTGSSIAGKNLLS